MDPILKWKMVGWIATPSLVFIGALVAFYANKKVHELEQANKAENSVNNTKFQDSTLGTLDSIDKKTDILIKKRDDLEIKDKQLKQVGLSILQDPKTGLVSIYINVDQKLGKIQDIALSMHTNGGAVGLRRIKEFKYFDELLVDPYMSTDAIDKRILEFTYQTLVAPDDPRKTVYISEFKGTDMVLQWRDAQGILHNKSWPYQDYREAVDALRRGFIRVSGTNQLMSQKDFK